MRALLVLFLIACGSLPSGVELVEETVPANVSAADVQIAIDRAVARLEACGHEPVAWVSFRYEPMPHGSIAVGGDDRVELGARVPWAADVESCYAAFVLEEVLAHELGHVVGFGHAPDPADAMYGAIPGCAVRPLRLNCGEKDL